MDNLETPSSNIDEKLHLHLTTPPATDTKSPSSILHGTVDSATESPREIHECTPKSDWIFQKRAWDMSNTALDSLMEMIGLCEVKKKFVEINTFIATSGRQQVSQRKNKFGAVFIGNPGTGEFFSTIMSRFGQGIICSRENNGRGALCEILARGGCTPGWRHCDSEWDSTCLRRGPEYSTPAG